MKELKITYYYDALCGWCYGFSPTFNKIYAEYQAEINFDVVSGGLFLGERVGPINKIVPYVKAGAYKTVESVTGVKFGQDFVKKALGEGKMTLNSLYPAIALCIIKADYPAHTVAFASLLHQAFYVDGMDSEYIEGYAAYAAKLGIESAEFNEKMKDSLYEEKAIAEFNHISKEGITGYPILTVEMGEEKAMLSNGYASYGSLKEKIDTVLGR
jgi:putative protein-disulfide isomerase